MKVKVARKTQMYINVDMGNKNNEKKNLMMITTAIMETVVVVVVVMTPGYSGDSCGAGD